MTFTKTKNLVYAVRRSLLNHNNFTSFWAGLPLISRIQQFSIPPIAWTTLCVPTAVRASTEVCSFYPTLVLLDVFVVCDIFRDVLKDLKGLKDLPPIFFLWNRFRKELPRQLSFTTIFLEHLRPFACFGVDKISILFLFRVGIGWISTTPSSSHCLKASPKGISHFWIEDSFLFCQEVEWRALL